MIKILWKEIKKFFSENLLIILLVFTTWLKLIWLDSIMFDDPKGPSAIFFVAFTASSSLLIYSFVFLFNRFRNWAALAIATITSLVLWADIVYFRYFGSIIKVEALQIARQTTGVGDSVAQLVSPIDVLFFLDIILVVAYLLIKSKRKNLGEGRTLGGSDPHEDARGRRQLRGNLKERIIIALVVLMVSTFPIAVMFSIDWTKHVHTFIYRNYDINLIEFRYGAIAAHGINTYRAIITAMESLDEGERVAAVRWIEDNATGQIDNEFTGQAKDKSIYLIQLESLQDFVIGRKFNGQEVTPNLNRLVEGSYYFENGFSVIGGGATSDSDLATNTSLYPLRDSAAFVQYGRNDYTSLPKALKEGGYSVDAYHGYRRDFWNRGTAYNSLGFEHFFAGEEYEPGEKILMGLSDESFYSQTLHKLNMGSAPSFSYVVSLSSHHPFTIPEEERRLSGSEQDYDFQTYHYFQAIHYADYSLGIFLDGLKERGLYDESLIVVYGDHLAKIGDLSDTRVAGMIESFDFTEMDKIPFIYKLPKQSAGTTLATATSQLDLMPTILNLAGVKTNYPMFGVDTLAGNKKSFTREEAIHYSELLIRFNLFEDLNK